MSRRIEGHVMPKLPVYLVPAPIGSYLSDMAVGSFKQLERVEHVFIESDSRVVRKLRSRGVLGSRQQLHLLDAHSVEVAEGLVEQGRSFALLADTGTPCFVDPGHEIIGRLLDRHLERVQLVPLGMSSALDAALACCGLDIQRFVFAGHDPENVDYAMAKGHRHPVVLYVAGAAAGRWARSLEEHLPDWQRVTLFGNLRDRSNERVARWTRKEQAPEWLRDDPSDNYVAVVERLR